MDRHQLSMRDTVVLYINLPDEFTESDTYFKKTSCRKMEDDSGFSA
jgi:hypothetical protein